jgi:hypothetical protein
LRIARTRPLERRRLIAAVDRAETTSPMSPAASVMRRRRAALLLPPFAKHEFLTEAHKREMFGCPVCDVADIAADPSSRRVALSRPCAGPMGHVILIVEASR